MIICLWVGLGYTCLVFVLDARKARASRELLVLTKLSIVQTSLESTTTSPALEAHLTEFGDGLSGLNIKDHDALIAAAS
jgi:hypothetical protein